MDGKELLLATDLEIEAELIVSIRYVSYPDVRWRDGGFRLARSSGS